MDQDSWRRDWYYLATAVIAFGCIVLTIIGGLIATLADCMQRCAK